MKHLADAHLTIIGTGLMGTSLARALHEKVGALYGVERSPEARKIAALHFDRVTADFSAVADKTDVVILAAPVRAILKMMDMLKQTAKPNTLILDLGSSKRKIVAAFDAFPDHLLAVGGHPMAGREVSGPDNASADLYRHCIFVMCPTQRSTPAALTFVENLIQAIGARPLTLSAARHDRAVAAISHVPYLISAALVSAVARAAGGDSTVWELASTGFRDTSRLAGSDPVMMGDTLLTNREAVIDALALFRQQLEQIEGILLSSDEDQLRAILAVTRQLRLDWFVQWNERQGK